MSLTDEIDAFRHRAFGGIKSQADMIDKITNGVRRIEAVNAEVMADLAQFFNGQVGFNETSLPAEPWPDPDGDLPPPPAMQNGNGNGNYGYQPPPPPQGYIPHPNGGVPEHGGEWPQVVQRQQPPQQPQYPARRFK